GKPWFSMPSVKSGVNIESQLKNRDSLLSLYKTLITVRKENKEFRSEMLEIVPNDNPNLLIYKRVDGSDISWVIINFSTDKEEIPLPTLENKKIKNLATGRTFVLKKGMKISGLDFLLLKEI
ncbi:MAG: hypothetical protein ACK4HQ_05195, partial [Brevinematales bacterium]